MCIRDSNNAMHAKPDLCVFLKWMIAGSGSVITDVIPLTQSLNPGFSANLKVLLASLLQALSARARNEQDQ